MTRQEIFDAAYAFTAKWEGGFSDHPSDKGGVTAYGVSLAFLKKLPSMRGDINGDGTVNKKDILAVTPEIAKQLFREEFWDGPKIVTLPPLVAVAAFDFAVNSGPGRAAICLQDAMNLLIPGSIPKTAGNFGPRTHEKAQYFSHIHLQTGLSLIYCTVRGDFFKDIVAGDSTQKCFLKGWNNRLADLRRTLLDYARKWGIDE